MPGRLQPSDKPHSGSRPLPLQRLRRSGGRHLGHLLSRKVLSVGLRLVNRHLANRHLANHLWDRVPHHLQPRELPQPPPLVQAPLVNLALLTRHLPSEPPASEPQVHHNLRSASLHSASPLLVNHLRSQPPLVHFHNHPRPLRLAPLRKQLQPLLSLSLRRARPTIAEAHLAQPNNRPLPPSNRLPHRPPHPRFQTQTLSSRVSRHSKQLLAHSSKPRKGPHRHLRHKVLGHHLPFPMSPLPLPPQTHARRRSVIKIHFRVGVGRGSRRPLGHQGSRGVTRLINSCANCRGVRSGMILSLSLQPKNGRRLLVVRSRLGVYRLWLRAGRCAGDEDMVALDCNSHLTLSPFCPEGWFCSRGGYYRALYIFVLVILFLGYRSYGMLA